MNKQEKLYRINKACNILVGYTTVPDKDRLQRALEEVLRVVEDIVKEN